MIKEKNTAQEITENEYAHWLFCIPGIGGATIDKLLCGGRSCKEVYEIDEKELNGILGKKQIKNLVESRNVWDFAKERQKLEKLGVRFVSRIDKEYPERLKNIPDPPFALYVKGKLPDESKPSVAIIGARMCSEYGRFMARQLGRGLTLAGVQVISGMARGVDGISQKAAVEAGGDSFAIVGSGVDICYPADNKPLYDELCEKGGIISEYPPGSMPKAQYFPMRNRIISGLADVVVVVEARLKSGTQITVDMALEQGKEVVALPGRVTDRLSDGCNQLICQGAGMVLGTQDILEKLFEVRSRNAENSPENRRQGRKMNWNEKTTEEEKPVKFKDSIDERIYDALDLIPETISQVAQKLYNSGIEIPITELLSRLMDMCGSGAIAQSGAYYHKIAGGTDCAKRFR